MADAHRARRWGWASWERGLRHETEDSEIQSAAHGAPATGAPEAGS